jgi:hypothetical protein
MVGEVPYNFRNLDVPDDLVIYMPGELVGELVEIDQAAQFARDLNRIMEDADPFFSLDVDDGVDVVQEVIDIIKTSDSEDDMFPELNDVIGDDEEAEQTQEDLDEEVNEYDDEEDPIVNGIEFNKIEDVADEFNNGDDYDEFIDSINDLDEDNIEETARRKRRDDPVDRTGGIDNVIDASISEITLSTS